MKVILDGKAYDAVTPDSITLADLLALKSATGMSREDLEAVAAKVRGMTEAQQMRSDEALLLAGVSVWLARRHAGELLTLEEACAVPQSKVEFRKEPGDPEDVVAPGSGPDPTRRASARGGAPAPQDRKPKKKTSSAKS